MDYAGNNGDSFHLNWSGHRVMYDILDSTGCDLSEWSGSNDGDEISAETAKHWGEVLASVVRKGRVRVKKVNSGHLEPLYGNEMEHYFVVADEKRGLIHEEGTDIDDDTKGWILGFARFLQQCEGCQQW